jgi:putative endonuclease
MVAMGREPCASSPGAAAEQRALEHLRAHGLELAARNYRSHWGEIDLVMNHADEIVFVEVRYRRSDTYGGGLASIDERKRQRIVATAQDFLARWGLGDRGARFDVVAVAGDGGIDWVAAAFDAG